MSPDSEQQAIAVARDVYNKMFKIYRNILKEVVLTAEVMASEHALFSKLEKETDTVGKNCRLLKTYRVDPNETDEEHIERRITMEARHDELKRLLSQQTTLYNTAKDKHEAVFKSARELYDTISSLGTVMYLYNLH